MGAYGLRLKVYGIVEKCQSNESYNILFLLHILEQIEPSILMHKYGFKNKKININIPI